MPIVIKRYVWEGVDKETLELDIGPLTLPDATFYIVRDIGFDDTIIQPPFVDAIMRKLGYSPDVKNTIALAPFPFVGILDAVGDVWALEVSQLGVLTTKKVS